MSAMITTPESRLAEIERELAAPGLTLSDWHRLTDERTAIGWGLYCGPTVARAVDASLTGYQPNYACKADDLTHGLPVAFSVRKDTSGKVVTEHGRQIRITEDGRKTTLGGRAIIDSKEQREAHKKHWGLEED